MSIFRRDAAPPAPDIDLYTLQNRHGGVVMNNGQDYYGPGPGHSRKDRSLHVTVKPDGAVLYHSFANDPDEAVRAHLGLGGRRSSPIDQQTRAREAFRREKVAAQERIERIAWCADRWREAQPAGGSPIEVYLGSRGITLQPPASLRYHPALPRGYGAKGGHPAMIGIIHGVDGTPTGLHATFLKPDGTGKATFEPAKQMFGYAKGGAVRLGRPTGGRLAVGEGIETCLSYTQLTGVPAYAALSAGNLGVFCPPPEVRELIVAADGDNAGREAAGKVLDAQKSSRSVAIYDAPAGLDWNDVLLQGGDDGDFR